MGGKEKGREEKKGSGSEKREEVEKNECKKYPADVIYTSRIMTSMSNQLS